MIPIPTAWPAMKSADLTRDRATGPHGPQAFAPGYLAAMVAGGLALIGLFGLTLLGLDRADRLPPPQLANNLCLDEKLRFLRNNPRFARSDFEPDVLIVGSSVSWRHFDGEAVVQATGGRAQVFNGGFCGLKINETLFATRYFLERYPSIREVATILAPQDLTECRHTRPELFNREDADRYVYEGGLVFPLYLKYFDPYTFFKNVLRMTSEEVTEWRTGFDRFGALPIDTQARTERLVYGVLPPYDPSCFDALRILAAELKASGRRLVVAAMPMHPAWLDRYDPERRRMRDLEATIGKTVLVAGGEFWRPRTFALTAEDFVDAIHIRWSSAQAYSRAMARETGLGQTAVPEAGRARETGLGRTVVPEAGLAHRARLRQPMH